MNDIKRKFHVRLSLNGYLSKNVYYAYSNSPDYVYGKTYQDAIHNRQMVAFDTYEQVEMAYIKYRVHPYIFKADGSEEINSFFVVQSKKDFDNCVYVAPLISRAPIRKKMSWKACVQARIAFKFDSFNEARDYLKSYSNIKNFL